MDAFGSKTPFRRSTEYSKKLAKDFMISMRMKKAMRDRLVFVSVIDFIKRKGLNIAKSRPHHA